MVIKRRIEKVDKFGGRYRLLLEPCGHYAYLDELPVSLVYKDEQTKMSDLIGKEHDCSECCREGASQ